MTNKQQDEIDGSSEYKAAYYAMKVASKKFAAIQAAYRSRQIGDAEFLAGRAEINKAEKAFDLAYAKEVES